MKIKADIAVRIIVVLINILVASLHLVINPRTYHGPLKDIVLGYLMDIMIPFAFYLLTYLSLADRLNQTFRVFIIVVPAYFVEVMQYFGYDFLGSTFDPLDIVAYTAGACSGLLIERNVIDKLILSNSRINKQDNN